MIKYFLFTAFAAAIIVALTILPNAAAAENEIPSTVVEDGQRAYLNLCASCHGKSGKGDGPMAPELTTKPSDLTRIALRSDGRFPFWHVYQTIDGRKIPRAHGAPDMPVWGSRYEMYYGSVATREWLLAITFYLESIQQK